MIHYKRYLSQEKQKKGNFEIYKWDTHINVSVVVPYRALSTLLSTNGLNVPVKRFERGRASGRVYMAL